jgi:hypothetical protein
MIEFRTERMNRAPVQENLNGRLPARPNIQLSSLDRPELLVRQHS